MQLDLHYLVRRPSGLKRGPDGVPPPAGYKTFGDPDFDFQSSCVTLETCLQLIQSWSVNHTDHIPITVYLEPREQTLLGNSSSINQQLASQPGEPQQ